MKGIYTTPKLFLRAVKIHILGRICQKKLIYYGANLEGVLEKQLFLRVKFDYGGECSYYAHPP